jgi:parallel beta-helix repeat protein
MIKTATMVVCTLLVITSFSSVLVAQERNDYELDKQQTSHDSYNCDVGLLGDRRDKEKFDDSKPFLPIHEMKEENRDLWESAPSNETPKYDPGSVLVKFTPDVDVSTADKALAAVEMITKNADAPFADVSSVKPLLSKEVLAKFLDKKSRFGLNRWVAITFDKRDIDILSEIEKYKDELNIEYAQPNYIMKTCLTPNDPYYSSSGSWGQDYPDLYGMHIINASDAWNITTGSHDVVVAVVDTGVDYMHEDITANMWINEDEIPGNGIDDDSDGFVDNIYGADFAYGDGDPMDWFGHGTHCAGTIAAVGNNTLGVVGMNWQAKIMAVKGLDDSGSGWIDDLADAIVWAADNGADVISNSWGPDYRNPSDPVIEDAVRYAYNKGCVLVFAAGNNNDDVQYYSPANMDEVIAVAATDYNDEKAEFSNWGEKIDVCAPGVDVLSTMPDDSFIGVNYPSLKVSDGYWRLSGTSMACPHVSGLAALLLGVYCPHSEVAERIISNADNIDALNPGYEGLLGSGRINAYQALPQFEHNVGVFSLDVPSHVKSHEMIYVNTTIFNNGQNNETNVLVILRINGSPVDSATISSFIRYTTRDVSFIWTPPGAGRYMVTINVTITDAVEDKYMDNEKSKMVNIGVLNNNTGRLFDTIQEAIDAPDTEDGHTIVVPCGTYHENVVIYKGISLVGADRYPTIIEGNEFADSIVHIISTYFVNISQFTLRNGAMGVYIESSLNTTVMDMMISNNTEGGIYLNLSDNSSITGNEIFGNTWRIQSTSFSSNARISHNCIHNNIHNNYDIAYGVGITIDSSSNNIVTENEIIGNFKGLTIDFGSTYNLIYHNTFNNTLNAFDAGIDNQWDTGYCGVCQCGGNQWSDYNGSDEFSGPGQNELGPDGIGDVPYNISGGSSQDKYPLMYPLDALVINLYTGEGFSIIQDAIDDPDTEDGHTIVVKSGTYYENIVINKAITLMGEDCHTTIIDSQGVGDVVHISTDRVNMTGFTIQKSASYNIGIFVESDYNTVSDNIITDNFFGIWLEGSYNTIKECISYKNKHIGIFLWYSSNNSIKDCTSYWNDYAGIYLQNSSNNSVTDCTSYWQFHGIKLAQSSNNNIANCIAYRTRWADIYLVYSSNNSITNCDLSRSYRVEGGDLGAGIGLCHSCDNIITNCYSHDNILGIRLWSSSNNNIISRSDITNNGDDVSIYDSSGNILSGNTISTNNDDMTYAYDYEGVILVNSSNNIISGNTITNDITYDWHISSYHGIVLSDASNNTISGNNITNTNDEVPDIYGIHITDSSDNNLIYHNNFIDNPQNAYDECMNTWDDGYTSGGNYWSNYDEPYEGAYDVNGDGRVDAPYRIPGDGTYDRYPLMYPWNETMVEPPLPLCGDVNADGKITSADVVYLINYLFVRGPAPIPLCTGDCNADSVSNIADVVYLINYLFTGGPAPDGYCCAS